MSVRVGTGYVDIEANLDPLKKQLAGRQLVKPSMAAGTMIGKNLGSTAAKEVEKHNKRITQSFATTAKRVVASGVGIAGAYIGIAKARDAVNTTEDLAKATLALHRNLGLTTKSASDWAAVAKARGVDTDSLSTAFTALSRNVVAATDKTSKQAAAFKTLGFSHKEVIRSQKDFNFLVEKTAQGLGGMEGGAKRAALAQQLLGRNTQTALPIFTQGRKSLQDNLDLAKKYGVELSGGPLKSLHEMAKAQKEWEFAQLGMKVAFTKFVAPALTGLMKLGGNVERIFNDPKMDIGQKFDKAFDEIGKLHLGDKLSQAIEHGVPVMLDTAGKAAPKVALAFVKAWYGAGVWGRLMGVGFLLSKMGAFSAVGKVVAKQFAERFLVTSGAEIAAGTAAEGVMGARVTRSMGGLGKLGGRAMGLGLAAGLALMLPDIAKQISDFLFAHIPGWKRPPHEPVHHKAIARGISKAYQSFPGPPPVPFYALGNRKGGVIRHLREGGLVPSMVSPGELLAFPDATSAVVPGARVAADSVFAPLPENTAVFTADGQRKMRSGMHPLDALRSQMPHFHDGGVASGTYSATAYGPPWGGIQGGGITKTGVNLRGAPHKYGIAVDPSRIRLGSHPYVWPNPFGYPGQFTAFDTGGDIQGSRIDFYDWRGRAAQLGWGRRNVRVSGSPLHGGVAVAQVAEARRLTAEAKRHALRGILPDAFSGAFDAARSGHTPGIGSILAAVRDASPQRRTRVPSRAIGSAGRPGAFLRARAAASEINSHHYPYQLGGNRNIGSLAGPMDCSGAVSKVLGPKGAGVLGQTEVSGYFMNWGQPGAGKLITTYARPGAGSFGHVFMKIGDRFFGTSRDRNPGGGAGWMGRSYPTAGFTARHPQGFRGGGMAGAIGNRAISRTFPTRIGQTGTYNSQAARAVLDDYTQFIDTLTVGQLVAQVHEWKHTIAKLLKGGRTRNERAQVGRMRGAISLVQAELGGRAGEFARRADRKGRRVGLLSDALDLSLRASGIDPESVQGLTRTGRVTHAQLGLLRGQRHDLTRALRIATRAGNTEVAGTLRGEIQGLDKDIRDLVVTRIEQHRQKIRAKAQVKVDAAQFGVDLGNANLAGLEASQRVAGTFDTDQGRTQRAGFITGTLNPLLQGMLAPMGAAFKAALKTGDLAGARSIWLDMVNVSTQIKDNTATANDLLKQNLAAASERAGIKTSIFQSKLTGLELDQKLAGTFDTKEGRKARSDFILNTLIPSIRGEETALGPLMGAARKAGDAITWGNLFNQWIGHENDIKQLTLDSNDLLTQVVDNTSESAQALADMLKDENLLWKQRYAVSQAQYPVIASLPPYGGSFADGGVVPGPPGAPRTVIAHGGETVGQPVVTVIVEDGAVDPNKIRVIAGGAAQEVVRRASRDGGRVLPGAGGGLLRG
jgi:3D (Asp-Asp-Asp) domain-containing protein